MLYLKNDISELELYRKEKLDDKEFEKNDI